MAMIGDIGIADAYQSILQPKLKNRWRVTFLRLGAGSVGRALTMQAVTIDRPKLSFGEVELHRYNSVGWVATKHTWDECAFSVEDDVSNGASEAIQDQLEQQQLLIANAHGAWLATASDASEYKFQTQLEMLDGGVNVLEAWILQGCWFKSVSYGDLAYSDGDQIKIDISIRFDHAYQVLNPYTSRASNGSAGLGLGIATGTI